VRGSARPDAAVTRQGMRHGAYGIAEGRNAKCAAGGILLRRLEGRYVVRVVGKALFAICRRWQAV